MTPTQLTREQLEDMCDTLWAEKDRLQWVVFPGGEKKHIAAFVLEKDARDWAEKQEDRHRVVQFGGYWKKRRRDG